MVDPATIATNNNCYNATIADLLKWLLQKKIHQNLQDYEFQSQFISFLGEGRMPSFERPTNPSTKFEADAVGARPVEAPAARDSLSKSNPLLLFFWPPQHVRIGTIL